MLVGLVSANSIIMNILHLLIPFYLVFTGCNLFNTGNDQEKFEPTFRAEINGEIFDITQVKVPLGRYNAGLSTKGNSSILIISGIVFSEQCYPFNEVIFFSLEWEKYQKEGSDNFISGLNFVEKGFYSELDGDAMISSYSLPLQDNGNVKVKVEELSDGREVVFGSFEFSVVVDSRTDQFSQRVGQDTLHITNGEYRLLLDDRRED